MIEEFQDRLFYGTDICDPRNATTDMLDRGKFLDDAVEQGKISYEAYYTSGTQDIEKVVNGVNYWGNIEINFIPMEAQVMP